MTNKQGILQTKCVSSLEKVFADESLESASLNKASALWNESYSFQVAYRNDGELFKGFTVEIDSDLKDWISVQSVGLVPSEFPIYGDHDANVLRATPGLYPDPLYPVEEAELVAFPKQWRSVWITVKVNEQIRPGPHSIQVKFVSNNDEVIGEEEFTLDVIPISLPKQELIHTEWFHVDCIAVEYGVEVFSDAHWQLLEKYIKTATDHGINMIYTPLFTPPLDTAIGGERPTVQLVQVEKVAHNYQFDFTQLKKWIEMCKDCGVDYFEFSHLFTQWGAKHAPKIIVRENGEAKKYFGWETDAAGSEYRDFLDQFLPQLMQFIEEEGIKDQAYFHVSDEPRIEDIDAYQQANAVIQKHVSEFPVMDALSDYDFYARGYVENPIVATNHIDVFLDNKIEDLWAYYCCSQYKDVSNRFFAFPSARNRIIGYQLFKYDIKGFLHWGYNFWFTQFAKKAINPYENTDAGHGFPSGDAFLVYPGKDGPVESIRLKVFYEALQDLRALQLLAKELGEEHVIQLIEKDLQEALTFTEYPHEARWILQKRETINEQIREKVKQQEN